eukprot:9157370-Ditylum_brightwellii.AAC.1
MIVGCPSGARNCPYTRQVDNKYCKHIPHTMHTLKVTIPGNLKKKDQIVKQTRMHLRWNGHIADFQNDEVKE